MRLFAMLGIVALGVGCGAAGEPPPAKAPSSNEPPAEVPLVAPDDPPLAPARPKLTEPVTIGETAAGVPGGGKASPAMTSTSWTRRDLFAEDRAPRGPIVRPMPRGVRYPVYVPGPAYNPPTPPPTMPGVGGNWPTVPGSSR